MEMKLQSFQKDRGKNILFSQEHLLQEAFQKKKDITLILWGEFIGNEITIISKG
ncbi:hypothetical protein [Bacillus cereus]|uniref:hypothetical protein n=1 Tax=Bacillus cereus TaxID=1396 RepID=UPI003C6C8957